MLECYEEGFRDIGEEKSCMNCHQYDYMEDKCMKTGEEGFREERKWR
jgi:nitrate/TMAO reductase-like tetraheme cytochrome c subunit